MLGYVHAGIGDANNIFHGKPVYGKASHAKAAGNVLFLKHGISRYPQAQALGQYLRLFDSGFRHQDNEFVPAVASHYIRLPALLLKESANASQHQIAFQMPLRVIDLFKLIQVHQHDRKWTARAGCPLPLGVQGLPEEAAGLYASQTIGNRLLLQLLKHESVMQRRGEQVGQSLHYQDVLRRERVFTLALDIQYALQFLAVSDRDAQDSMRIRQDALQTLVTSHLHQSRLSSSRHSTDDAGPKRNPFAKDLRRNARLRPDLDLFREVIKNSDSDVIEAKIFLDMADDLGKHLLGILARDGCLRDAVEKSKLAGAALFFGEEPRIFHRDR